MSNVVTEKAIETLNQFLKNNGVQNEIFKNIDSKDNEIEVIYNNLVEFKKIFDKTVLQYNTLKKEEKKQILIDGAKIVFLLREFLTGKELFFIVGATNDNKTLLAEQEISREILFKNLDINSKAVLLGSKLENFKNMSIVNEETILKQWKTILNLSDVRQDIQNDNYTDVGREVPDSHNKPTPIYRRTSADTEVYFRFASLKGKKKRGCYRYYSTNLNFFNDGWLYEWYKAYIGSQMEDRIEELTNSLNKGSIHLIIRKMDNIPGYKGGDFVQQEKDEYGHIIYKWYQAKYGNQQIITYKSIQTVLDECIRAFGSDTILSERKKILKELFISTADKEIPSDLIETEISHLSEVIDSLENNYK